MKRQTEAAYTSVRLSATRVIQRRMLNVGEPNTTQLERWQRSIEVIHQEGERRQYRLFTDREGATPPDAADVCEVILSSLSVRHPRQFGACWLGSRLWQELGLDTFFAEALQDRRGPVAWSKVIELLAVNRLCDPQSELSRAPALVWHHGHGHAERRQPSPGEPL